MTALSQRAVGAPDDLQRRDPRTLHPHPHNSRRHDRLQIDHLKKSLSEFGVMRPILVDEGDVVLAGHGVREAAIELGLSLVDVVVKRGLTDAQKRAYLIADNRLGELSTWDTPLMRAELEALEMALPSFSVASLFGRQRIDGVIDPDDIPKAAPKRAARGDLWMLGRHRLLCGDSTDPTDVTKALGEALPGLMVTDPPYGVDYDPAWRKELPTGGRSIMRIEGDDRADWREAWRLFPGGVAFVWHADRRAAEVHASLEAEGLIVRQQIIWLKPMTISRGHYHYRHEPCWYCVRDGASANWRGSRSESSVWECGRDVFVSNHSTQKPVDLMLRPIYNHTDVGEWVYDPFIGTGTTILAAEQAERRCVAIDLVPEVVDIAIERWQQFTGQEAVKQ